MGTHGSNGAIDIERVVREVISRLAGRIGAETEKLAKGESEEYDQPLRISGRVVSLEQLPDQLEGLRQIVVTTGAVVTPAACDVLREAEVTVVYDTPTGANEPSRASLAIGATVAGGTTVALLNQLKSETQVEQIAGSELPLVVERLSGAVEHEGRVGVLLTSETAAASCLANRRPAVRAAVVDGVADVGDAIRTIGANLMVLDPRGRSMFDLQRCITTFCSDWPRRGDAMYESEMTKHE